MANKINPIARLANNSKIITIKEFVIINPLLFLAKAAIIPKDKPNEIIANENAAVHILKLSNAMKSGFKKE